MRWGGDTVLNVGDRVIYNVVDYDDNDKVIGVTQCYGVIKHVMKDHDEPIPWAYIINDLYTDNDPSAGADNIWAVD